MSDRNLPARVEGSVYWNVFAVIGLLTVGAIVVPSVIALITALPDIRRYLKIRQM